MTLFLFFACSTEQNINSTDETINGIFTNIESRSLSKHQSERSSIIPSEWDGYNEPNLVLGESYEANFSQIPLAAQLDKEPWSGYYWAKNKAGIAYRWRVEQSFDYETYQKEDVFELSLSDIESLSPAEKYDLLVGNYDWPLTIRALSNSSPTEADWTGYCHGWAPASLAYEEPKPIILENEDGIRIPFGSSDIKALLTYFRAEVVTSQNFMHDWRAENKVLGSVCGSAMPTDPSCYDTNPGTFHIILGNMIAHRNEGFIMDVESTFEKWNQPVFAYDAQIIAERPPNEYASNRAIKEYIIENTVSWTVEISPTYTPVLHTNRQVIKEQIYVYSIEVDEHENIIGGQWMTETEDGNFIPLPLAWEYLIEIDDNEDGQPDFTKHQVAEKIWKYFKIPDYIWTQSNVGFPSVFEDVYSSYSLIATTNSSREDLYFYFGHLGDLYHKSLE